MLPADACLFRAEHPAAGGDVYATALADGAGDACGFERALEFDGGGGGGGGAAESVRGVERDEVDVGADAGEQRGEARESALLVVGVTPGSPAEQAGVLIGDLLLDFDGSPVRSPEELLALLNGDAVGRAVPLRVLRGASTATLAVTPQERPER